MRAQLGTTTIYVTHVYLEAMSRGDRVAVVSEGHLLQLGTKSILTLKAVDGNFVRALVDGHLTFEMDRRTQFRIDPHLLVIFDAETRRFLARSAEPTEEV